MLNPQEGGRLDAKRHEVIFAKALDGIWPGSAVLGHGGGRRVPQHSTAQAWPTGQIPSGPWFSVLGSLLFVAICC